MRTKILIIVIAELISCAILSQESLAAAIPRASSARYERETFTVKITNPELRFVRNLKTTLEVEFPDPLPVDEQFMLILILRLDLEDSEELWSQSSGIVSVAYDDSVGEIVDRPRVFAMYGGTKPSKWESLVPPSDASKYWGPRLGTSFSALIGIVPIAGQAYAITQTIGSLLGPDGHDDRPWLDQNKYDVVEFQALSTSPIRQLRFYKVEIPLKFTGSTDLPLHVYTVLNVGCLQRGWQGHIEKSFHIVSRRLSEQSQARIEEEHFEPQVRVFDHGSRVFDIAISPGGDVLAASGTDIKLWNLRNGNWINTLAPKGGSRSGVFDPTGRLLVSGCEENTVMWDYRTGKIVHEFPVQGDRVSISPDGSFVAIKCWNRIEVWDVHQQKKLQSLPGYQYGYGPKYSPKGNYLAHTMGYGKVYVWHAQRLVQIRALSGPDIPGVSYNVNVIAFSPDDSLVAVGTSCGMTFLFRLMTGAHVATINAQRDPRNGVSGLEFSPNGLFLAVGYEYGHLACYHVASGRQLSSWDMAPSRYVEAIAFTPDGRYLLAGASNGIIRVLDTPPIQADEN